jgi:hypothetical protein
MAEPGSVPVVLLTVGVRPGDDVLIDTGRGRWWLPVTHVEGDAVHSLIVRLPDRTDRLVALGEVQGWRRGYEVQAPAPLEHPAQPPYPPDGTCRHCGAVMPAGLHPFPWCDAMEPPSAEGVLP